MLRPHGVLIALCGAMLLTLSGCSENSSPTASSSENLIPETALTAIVPYELVEGQIGPGSLYALVKPYNWNGDLVIYAHGYVFPNQPVALPEAIIDELREELVELGYGVAYSSYPENGWAVKEGMITTRQLRGLFAEHFGEPQETYLIGTSMGGLVSLALGEKNPGLFTGILPTCGVVGGADHVIEYVFGTRVLFDYYYPNVLPGNAIAVPPDLDIGAAQQAIVTAIFTNPAPLFELASVQQLDLRYNSLDELVTTVVTALTFQLLGSNELAERVGSRSPFDNRTIWYSGTSDDAALNAGVDRFSMEPPADRYYDHNYEPDGQLRIPVMTLHTTRDPVVNVNHEDRYAQTVAAAGRSSFLQQRTIDRFGHCAFTTQEIIEAFLDLVVWSQSMNALESP